MTTKIEWVKNPDGGQGVTWNPAVGCHRVSPGCDHCYAARMASRCLSPSWFDHDDLPLATNGRWSGQVRLYRERLLKPLRWRKPRTVFVCSMGDLFHDEVPDGFIAAIFGVMAATPQHQYMLLTKRPERALEWFRWLGRDPKLEVCWEALRHEADVGYCGSPWPLPNVMVGVTAEDQQRADERIPVLLQIPAALHWASVEPCLGPIDISPRLGDPTGPSIGFVVVGGETGPNARPMHPDWARSLRDQCVAADVPFFFKQWGEWRPHGSVALWRDGGRESTNEGLCLMADGRVIGRDRPFSEYDARQRQGYGDTRVQNIEPEWSAWCAAHDAAEKGGEWRWPYGTLKWMYRDGKKAAGRELDGVVWEQMPGKETP